MGKEYITYYKLKCGSFRVMKSENNELCTYERLPDSVVRKYHVFKGYEANDDGLIQYTNDFKTWCKELKNNDIYKLNYIYYSSHQSATERVFKNISKSRFEGIQEVSTLEHKYMSMCHNGGLTYCEPFEGECFGYDFNAYYPRLLSSQVYEIPVRQGEECYTDVYKLLTEKTKLSYGMYYVQITSNNPNCKKVFAFSKNHVYTHYSIEFAYKNREQFDFEFAYYQEEDGFNSYVYDQEDLMKGNDIFCRWFTRLTDLRVLFPKNKLLKHLLSSIWGSLTRHKKINRTYEEIQNEKLDVGHTIESHYQIHDHVVLENGDYYILHNNKEVYHYGLARIKSFLTSYGRNRTANVALKDIDSVIRIHTDNVTFTEPQDITKIRHLYPEAKTTGKLKWTKINAQPERLTTKP